jgi:aldehyde dehydrogenase (NAD+)
MNADTRYRNLIGEHWLPGEGAQRLSLNPSKPSEVLGTVEEASAQQVADAFSAAARAFAGWRKTPSPERGRVIARAAAILRQKKEELAATMSREEGKLLREARGEIEKGLLLMDYYAGEGLRLGGETIPSEVSRTFTYTLRQPLGVVALITPWNFPVAIPIWKAAPALVAGNTVVMKPSPLTPACAVLLAEAFQEAGLPAGVFNLVQGDAAVGEAMMQAPSLRAISFTGSTPVGMSIYQKGAARGLKVTCEMGGKNAVVVLDDADLDLAATGILQGAFGSTGQRCTATSRVICHPSVKAALLERVVEGAKKLIPGDPFDDKSGLGPAVSEPQMQKVLQYIEITKSEGAKLLCGGGRASEAGYFLSPTVFDGVVPNMRLAREEAFGPVLAVLEASTLEEAIALTNDTEFGLTASIYSRDPGALMEFTENAEVGMVHLNQPTVGGEAQLPFGGVKKSGIGDREMGKPGIEFFTELKTVFYDFTGAIRKTSIY